MCKNRSIAQFKNSAKSNITRGEQIQARKRNKRQTETTEN